MTSKRPCWASILPWHWGAASTARMQCTAERPAQAAERGCSGALWAGLGSPLLLLQTLKTLAERGCEQGGCCAGCLGDQHAALLSQHATIAIQQIAAAPADLGSTADRDPENVTERGCEQGACCAGCLGDQHAALLGQRCRPLEAKNTYGTGCFLLLHTGAEPVASEAGLLTTLVHAASTDHVALRHASSAANALRPIANHSLSCLLPPQYSHLRIASLCRLLPLVVGIQAGLPAEASDCPGLRRWLCRHTSWDPTSRRSMRWKAA